MFAKGRSDSVTPQLKALPGLPLPLDRMQTPCFGLRPFLPEYPGLISGHSGSPETFFLPFTRLPASQSLQMLPRPILCPTPTHPSDVS